MRHGDAADRLAVKVRRGVVGQVFHVIEGVLDHAADATVITRTGDEEAVGASHCLDQSPRALGAMVGFNVVDGKEEVASD
jgi:hypothetical protein